MSMYKMNMLIMTKISRYMEKKSTVLKCGMTDDQPCTSNR